MLVINHEEQLIVHRENGKNANYASEVFYNMIIQILKDYKCGIPKYTELNREDIIFLYNGLKPELKHKPPEK